MVSKDVGDYVNQQKSIEENEKVTEAPKVYCPKEKKKVPVWYCLGSFSQNRPPCSSWSGEATVNINKNFASVVCNFIVEKTGENKMKVVYVSVEDPVAWRSPTATFSKEDIEFLVCNVVRHAGLLIDENDERIIIGEIQTGKDNPKLTEFGLDYPVYRAITIIGKKHIVDRQDFEIVEVQKK